MRRAARAGRSRALRVGKPLARKERNGRAERFGVGSRLQGETAWSSNSSSSRCCHRSRRRRRHVFFGNLR